MSSTHCERGQPLTALGGYIEGMRRGLQPAWPDKVQLDQGVTQAAAQVARTSEALNRLRALGEHLRDPRLRQSHARMTAAFSRAERIMQNSREATRDTTTILTQAVVSRQERAEARGLGGNDVPPVRRAIVLKNIRLFQRLLQQEANDTLDTRTERTLKQLLVQEYAKLAALDQQEGG